MQLQVKDVLGSWYNVQLSSDMGLNPVIHKASSANEGLEHGTYPAPFFLAAHSFVVLSEGDSNLLK